MPLLTQEQMLAPQNNSIAIIGPPKTGKTESLATAWKHFAKTKQLNDIIEIFDLDDDGAISLIRKAQELGKLDRLRVHRLRREAGRKINVSKDEGLSPARYPDEWIQFANEFNKLYDMVDSISGQWKDPPNSPGLIVVDSATSLQDLAWDFVLAKRNKEIGIDDRRVGFDEWNLIRSKIVSTISAAKGLPCHCAFPFHLDHKMEEAGKKQKINDKGQVIFEAQYVDGGAYYHVPAIVGQLSFTVLGEFGICLESEFKTSSNKYMWKVVPDERSKSLGSRAHSKFPGQYIDQDLSLVL